MEDTSSWLKIPKSECRNIWIRLPKHKWPKIMSNMGNPVAPLERNLCDHLLAGLLRNKQFEKIPLEHCWEKNPNWECLFVNRQKRLFLSVNVDIITMAGETQKFRSNVESIYERSRFGRFHPLTMFIWVLLNENVQHAKILWTAETCLNPGFPQKLQKSDQIQRNLAQTFPHGPVKWKVILRNVWSDVANWRTEQLNSFSKSQLKRRNKICWRLVKSLLSYCSKMFVFGTHLLTRNSIVCGQTCTCYHWVDPNNIVMWETQHNDADKDYFRSLILLEIYKTHKSTSGGLLCIFGSHTFVPISWMCKKQTSVSHSSTEAEIVSFDASLRVDGKNSWSLGFGYWIVPFFLWPIKEIQRNRTGNPFCVTHHQTSTPTIKPRLQFITIILNEAMSTMSRRRRSFLNLVGCFEFWKQRNSDWNVQPKHKSKSETRIQNPQKCSWLVFRQK